MKSNFLTLTLFFAMGAIALFATQKGLSSSREIPEPFKGSIVSLRSANIGIDQKIQDLQKEIGQLQNERNWNCARMQTVANEALNHEGLSGDEYRVNIDKLKIIPFEKH